jgi:hypothetical protein
MTTLNGYDDWKLASPPEPGEPFDDEQPPPLPLGWEATPSPLSDTEPPPTPATSGEVPRALDWRPFAKDDGYAFAGAADFERGTGPRGTGPLIADIEVDGRGGIAVLDRSGLSLIWFNANPKVSSIDSDDHEAHVHHPLAARAVALLRTPTTSAELRALGANFS